jgi:hypothetical protein
MPYFEGIQQILHWRSSPSPINAGIGTSHGTFFVAPLDVGGDPFSGLILANSFALAVSGNLTATSVSQQLSSSCNVGIYTRSGSTLNLVNSASAQIQNTNASTANTSRWNGVRLVQIVASQWSKTPYFQQGPRYYIAVQFLSHITTGAMSLMNAVSAGTAYSGIAGGGVTATGNEPFSPFRGVFNATTNAVPTTIQASQISGTGANGSVFPFVRIDQDFANY